MNYWTTVSIELANQRNYLDLLYRVYPISPNLRRELSAETIELIRYHYENRNNDDLLRLLLQQEIFPIKDSYVAYLKRDPSAIERNPNTINRLQGMLIDMGVDEIVDKITAPKETNRQIGPMFKNWIKNGALGCEVTDDENRFLNSQDNIVFDASDSRMQNFAREHLGYTREKGLDLIAKFNNTYVIGEVKFLTDFGGHQNAQFNDAISTMTTELRETDKNVKAISVLDGVLYIQGNSRMYNAISRDFSDDDVIISAVLLRDYLYSL